MYRPQVSVIMSSYNPRHEEWLFGAIESLLRQTLTDWELILWDDGSDAAGSQLLHRAARLDPRIKLFSEKVNRGLAYGLNRCLEQASGVFIARMDDDDLSAPQRFETQVRFLNNHPEVDWLGSKAWLFDSEGIWGVHEAVPDPGPTDYLPFSPFIHPSVMFRAESLRRAGGYLDLPLTRRCEDYELFMRMSAMGMKGLNLQQELLCYRENRELLTKRTFHNCWREMRVRLRGFQSLQIGFFRAVPAAVKPMLVWIVSWMPRTAQSLRRNRSSGMRRLQYDGGNMHNED